MQRHNRAALIGLLWTMPFFVMNLVISLRLEPIHSFLGAFPMVRQSTFTPLVLLLFLPLGGIIAMRPMLTQGANGKCNVYILNLIIALLLFSAFLFLFSGLAKDFYTCDILKIPNCD